MTVSNNAALTSGNDGLRDIAITGGTLPITGSTGGNSPVNNISGTSLSISSGATFEAANSTSGIPTSITKTSSGTGTGDVIVDSGTRLEVTGSVAGAINVSGVLTPGASIESFGSGSVAFSTGSTFAYELDSKSLGGVLLDSTGTLDIAAGTILTLTELASGTLADGSKLKLISYAGGWVNTHGLFI